MNNGSYDRRAPSASSQIITLERLLEESEARNEKLREGIEDLNSYLGCMLDADPIIVGKVEALLEDKK